MSNSCLSPRPGRCPWLQSAPCSGPAERAQPHYSYPRWSVDSSFAVSALASHSRSGPLTCLFRSSPDRAAEQETGSQGSPLRATQRSQLAFGGGCWLAARLTGSKSHMSLNGLMSHCFPVVPDGRPCHCQIAWSPRHRQVLVRL